jgi:hypothetical protein
VTEYWEFGDGIVLVRRTFTKTGGGFRLMSTGTKGQWLDDHYCGWRMWFDFANKLDTAEAQKVAAQLGESLEDDGGIVPMDKNGLPKDTPSIHR